MSSTLTLDPMFFEGSEAYLDENIFEFVVPPDEFSEFGDDFDVLTTTSTLTCEGTTYSVDSKPLERVKDEAVSVCGVACSAYPDTVAQLPRIVKNDIRRSLPLMYMNTLNCGDFQQVQNFSQTFIRPDSLFVARIQSSGEYQLPTLLHGWGARAHVHYMIGVYVTFPDLVVTFGDSKLITSSQFSGTKVIIPGQSKMTKTRHIPVECWVPSEEIAEKMYLEPSIDRMMQTLSLTNANCESVEPAVKEKTKRKRKRKLIVTPPEINRSQPVPLTFVQNLQQSATLFLPTPQLVVEGTYTIILDESHHITSITLEVVQTNTSRKARK